VPARAAAGGVAIGSNGMTGLLRCGREIRHASHGHRP
jgi:hypothetical protein